MTGQHLVLCDGPAVDAARVPGRLCALPRDLAAGSSRRSGRSSRRRSAAPTAASSIWCTGRSRSTKAGSSIASRRPASVRRCSCIGLRDDLPEFRTRIDDAAAAMMPHLLFEMALRGLIADGETSCGSRRAAPRLVGRRRRIRPPRGRDRLGVLRLARRRASPAAPRSRTCRSTRMACATGCEAPGGFRFERRYHPVGNVTHFATVDHNPIAAFEAHPNKARKFRRPRRPAGSGVDRHPRPGVRAHRGRSCRRRSPRCGSMLHEVIPVGYDDERHLSASYREAIGTMYLTLHPNVMTMTEAVLHEFQHNKLNVASYERRLPRERVPPPLPEPGPPRPSPAVGHSPGGARVPAGGGALPSHARLPSIRSRRIPASRRACRRSTSRTTRAWRCYVPTRGSPRRASPCSATSRLSRRATWRSGPRAASRTSRRRCTSRDVRGVVVPPPRPGERATRGSLRVRRGDAVTPGRSRRISTSAAITALTPPSPVGSVGWNSTPTVDRLPRAPMVNRTSTRRVAGAAHRQHGAGLGRPAKRLDLPAGHGELRRHPLREQRDALAAPEQHRVARGIRRRARARRRPSDASASRACSHLSKVAKSSSGAPASTSTSTS